MAANSRGSDVLGTSITKRVAGGRQLHRMQAIPKLKTGQKRWLPQFMKTPTPGIEKAQITPCQAPLTQAPAGWTQDDDHSYICKLLGGLLPSALLLVTVADERSW